jgi:hypothetical protein
VHWGHPGLAASGLGSVRAIVLRRGRLWPAGLRGGPGGGPALRPARATFAGMLSFGKRNGQRNLFRIGVAAVWEATTNDPWKPARSLSELRPARPDGGASRGVVYSQPTAPRHQATQGPRAIGDDSHQARRQAAVAEADLGKPAGTKDAFCK